MKGIIANLLKEENTELWTNPLCDWVGNGCREEFQAPQDESMEAKQKRFEECKPYDGQRVRSQMIRAQQQGEHLRFIVEAAADGSSVAVGNQWMPNWMEKIQQDKNSVKLSDGCEMAKMHVIVEKYNVETGDYLGMMEEVPECKAPDGHKCRRKVNESCRVGFSDPKGIKVKLVTLPEKGRGGQVMANYRIEPPNAFQEVKPRKTTPAWLCTALKGHEWVCGAKQPDTVDHDGVKQMNQN